MSWNKSSNELPALPKLRSFIQYDANGEACVLRSNVKNEGMHPGAEISVSAELPVAGAAKPGLHFGGSLRLFGNFADLKLAK
jgi:hypothetical protein